MKSKFFYTYTKLLLLIIFFVNSKARVIDDNLPEEVKELLNTIKKLKNQIGDLFKLLKEIDTSAPDEAASVFYDFLNNDTEFIKIKVLRSIYYLKNSFVHLHLFFLFQESLEHGKKKCGFDEKVKALATKFVKYVVESSKAQSDGYQLLLEDNNEVKLIKYSIV